MGVLRGSAHLVASPLLARPLLDGDATMRPLFLLIAVGAATSACAAPADEEATTDEAPLTRAVDAQRVLYLDAAPPAQCATGADADRIRCLIGAKYAVDPAAREVALDFFATTGGVPGILPAQQYDGGYRGIIDFVPELPVSNHRKHLIWSRDAMRDIGAFMANIAYRANAPVRFRHREIQLRFFRSVGRTTPSAFTQGNWELGYNVSGSLVQSAALVRETFFHEMFHMNDWSHNDWSSRTLAPIVNGIVARCGARTACLAPYAPTNTIVRGGTYYAFQPGNGPMHIEYAAELATRYFEEQLRAMTNTRRSGTPFKCGPAENRKAWDLLRNEFFGGVDLVPACH